MKKSYQSSIVGLSLSNQIISITITGDFMILFMSQILGFSDLQNSWLITMLPIIALIRIPLSYLMRRKNLLHCFSSSVSDNRGARLWTGLESFDIIGNR